jgi:hypothetical protein
LRPHPVAQLKAQVEAMVLGRGAGVLGGGGGSGEAAAAVARAEAEAEVREELWEARQERTDAVAALADAKALSGVQVELTRRNGRSHGCYECRAHTALPVGMTAQEERVRRLRAECEELRRGIGAAEEQRDEARAALSEARDAAALRKQ